MSNASQPVRIMPGKKTFLFGLLLAGLGLLGQPATAQASAPPAIPSEFGQVVFHKEGAGNKHLYIIGQSHRSAASGLNGPNTVRSQADIYRIGEWLIRHAGVELLLPEGFFRRPGSAGQIPFQRASLAEAQAYDYATLEAKFADTSVFINADMLLRSNYQVGLQQVEDREIYQRVGEFMQRARNAGNNIDVQAFNRELNFIQEVRTAAMLQNVPQAISGEFSQGNISNQRALFTIGMAHISEIIRFFRQGHIEIPSPALPERTYDDYRAALNLLNEGYGVTIILPRTLLEDQEALRMAKLQEL